MITNHGNLLASELGRSVAFASRADSGRSLFVLVGLVHLMRSPHEVCQSAIAWRRVRIMTCQTARRTRPDKCLKHKAMDFLLLDDAIPTEAHMQIPKRPSLRLDLSLFKKAPPIATLTRNATDGTKIRHLVQALISNHGFPSFHTASMEPLAHTFKQREQTPAGTP
jgi:hypothetical protein